MNDSINQSADAPSPNAGEVLPFPRNTKGALAGITPESILDRYCAGEEISQIAKTLGVTPQAVNKMILANAPDQWQEHQAARALADLQDADLSLERAETMVDVARASARLRSHQWKLERVLRRIYGTDIPANLQAAITINIGINRDNGAVLRVDPTKPV